MSLGVSRVDVHAFARWRRFIDLGDIAFFQVIEKYHVRRLEPPGHILLCGIEQYALIDKNVNLKLYSVILSTIQ